MENREKLSIERKTAIDGIYNDMMGSLKNCLDDAFRVGWEKSRKQAQSEYDVTFDIPTVREQLNNVIESLNNTNESNYREISENAVSKLKSVCDIMKVREPSEITQSLGIKINDVFEVGVEYSMRRTENEEAKLWLMGKHIHVYNRNCSCPGNNIKIDTKGKMMQCTVHADGEHLYGLVPDDGTDMIIVTSRSNFINFKILD